MFEVVPEPEKTEAGDYPASYLSRALPLYCNTSDDVLYANVRRAVEAGYPIAKTEAAHDRVALIVGGGPSLADDIDDIRARHAAGAIVFALNGAGLWLQERGIVPDWLIILDARSSNARFIATLPSSVKCLLASQCDQAIFDAAAGHEILAWHPSLGGKSGVVEHRESAFIGGGTSVGMRALRLLHVLGYRTLHLYGYDSCYRGDDHHAYRQDENANETIRECFVGGRKFYAAAWMIRQADAFQMIAASLLADGTNVHVHGDGLLPMIAREMGREYRQLTFYYDLSVCPVGYDFVSSLALAEQERINQGCDSLNVVFVPGPCDGFREHETPRDTAQRQQMFWGIAMGLCRCLPSIKSVKLLNSPGEVPEDLGEHVFPHDYALSNRVGVYGITYLLEAMRQHDLARFEAPEWARRQVRKWVKPNTVTITLREASYVDGRNSLIDEWERAADVLRDRGFHVVFVRDTEKAYGEDAYGFQVCHVASYDMGMRLALYEAAAVNCFVANGPFTLGMLGKHVKGIVFGLERDGDFAMSAAHWRARGLPVGSELPNTNGRFKAVWERENEDNIVKAVSDFIEDNPQGLSAVYDLAHCPASFDFIPWLIAAEMARLRSGKIGPLRVRFAPGPRDGFRDDALPAVDRNRFLNRVLRPTLRLLGAAELADGRQDHRYDARIYTIRPIVEAAKRGERVPLLSAPVEYHDRAAVWCAGHGLKKPVVIVLREASHWPARNSKLLNWKRIAGVIRGSGRDVLIVRDTEKADEPLPGFVTCPEASHDLLFQIALYEQASCVMATSAPGFIALFTRAPCLIFPVIDMPDYPPSTDAWWRAHHGIGHGEQFPWSRPDQRIAWDGDSYPSLKKAWDEFETLTEGE